MTQGRALFAATCMMVSCATSTIAQRAGVGRYESTTIHAPQSRAKSEQPATSSAESFFVEAAGGVLGSGLGAGIVLLSTSCGGDDLGCGILKIGSAGLVGAIGATLGTTLAARHTGSRRSVVGAALGAVVGTGAGLTIQYFVTRGRASTLGDRTAAPIIIVSQGIVSAIGSRLVGR